MSSVAAEVCLRLRTAAIGRSAHLFLTWTHALETVEKALRFPPQAGFRAERPHLPELPLGALGVADPDEQEAEMEPHRLGAREAPGQWAEPREGRGRLVLVEPRDRGGRERLRVVGGEPHRVVEDPPADTGLPTR